jgi:predicted DNA-binding transcriptional regulator AlpA
MSIEDTLAEISRKLDALRFQPSQDLLLTAEQAAELLQVSSKFLYQHAKKLPYTVTLTNGTKKTMVRFSYSGIQKYISKKLKIQEAKNG